LGPHWTSSLEHGVRLTNWAIAWQLLLPADGSSAAPIFDGEEGERFRQLWLKSVYQHCHFIAGHLSKFSSANNHLFGEYMGLFIGALNWPLWPQSTGWKALAHAGIEEEALKQIASDGVNREQALWYQHEVADMMLLCGLFGRENGVEFSSAYWKRLETMLEFIASVLDAGGNAPSIGDADDAVMVRFSCEPDFDVYHSLLATGAVLFKRGDFKRKAGRFDAKTRWLLGDDVEKEFDTLNVGSTDLPVRRAFTEGGYYILGGDFETAREVRVVADVAPLGYLSIAAHGHADALAFTLSAGGHPLLIDSGTYSYHTDKMWRDYFRGTSAHNTMRVDGVDQSVSGGNFLWLKHAAATCEGFEYDAASCYLVGSHDGYMRLPQGVRHRRVWTYDVATRSLRVVDALEGSGAHRVEIFWHFAPACNVELKSDRVTVRSAEVALQLVWPQGLDARLVHGEDDPPLGWTSSSFDRKTPCTTLVVEGTVKSDSKVGWRGTTELSVAFIENRNMQ
ncbi:MAG TPA: alginate lyase family protein, partial [Rhodocyclaceae bacterium]|nr:alginate lyase family protein [Rhodocyclaceae bacterium]